MTTQRVSRRGSVATAVLEKAWARLRVLIPDLPSAVMVLMDVRGRRRSWGYFAASTWRVRGPKQAHEVAINPNLFRDPASLLETLLHEAAHAQLYANDPDNPSHVGGVSRDRRGYYYYHRKEFRDAARQLGLNVEYLNGRYGWTLTHWPEGGVPDAYRSVLRLLEGSLPWGTADGYGRFRIKGRPLPISGQVRMRCRCVRSRSISVARSQAERGGIVCGFCNSQFVAYLGSSMLSKARA